MQDFREAFKFLRERGLTRRQIAILLALAIGSVLFEALGLGLLMPIGQYLIEGGELQQLRETSRFWQAMFEASDYAGFEIGIVHIAGLSLLAMCIRQVFAYFRLVYQAQVNHNLARKIRVSLFSSYLHSDLITQEREGAGQFANTVTTEVNQVLPLVSLGVEVIITILLAVVYLGLMLAVAPAATLVMAALLGVSAFLLRSVFRKTALVGKTIVQANTVFLQHLVERTRNTRMVRLSRMEDLEIQLADDRAAIQRDANVRAKKLTAITEAGMEPITIIIGVPLLILAVTVYGMALATVGFMLVLLARMMPIAKQGAGAWQSLLRTGASVRVVRDTLSRLQEVREVDSGHLLLPDRINLLSFRNVSYRYRPDEPEVLRGVDLDINEGEFIGLVGPSGAGKSTLIDLIPRLRLPTGGTVKFNGTSIDEFKLSSLRNAVAFVGQSPLMMAGTVGEQIAYAKPDASMEEIEEAARQANAHDFICSLPNGYETLLGEDGKGLSGGQRQRIELARALLRKVPILILDEPTSSLDAESEFKIRQALAQIHARRNTTIILIGHRLSSLEDADRIIVLKDGAIVEEGSQQDLIRTGGWFAGAMNRQQTGAPTPLLREEAI